MLTPVRTLALIAFVSSSVMLSAGSNPSSIALTSSLNPSLYGQSVVLTATLSPLTASGSVTFYDGPAFLGVVAISGAQAALSTPLLYSGLRNLQARYSGDSDNAPTVSPLLTQLVVASPSSAFGAPATYTEFGSPVALTISDFNGDGYADIAVVNQTANAVTVLLGSGSGAFAPAVNYDAGPGPIALAVSDFNGDGRPDLVVANEDANTITILLNNGDGTFAPVSAINVGSSPVALAVSDFNDDGIADVAVALQGNNTVAILQGDGDGTFAAPVNYTVGSLPSALALGDFNGDGIADLAVTDQSDGAVSILIGNGDGTFAVSASVTVNSNPAALVVGDFNQDGKADLAVAGANTSTVTVLLGNGDGTFGSAPTLALPIAAVALAVADFNGDGFADLAISSSTTNAIATLLGDGDGTFQPPLIIAVGGGPVALAAAEFNGDGRTDLAVVDETGASVSVLFGAPAVIAASIALIASPNPSSYGQIVILTAAVSPAAATGSVTFNNGAAVLGSTPLVNGVATFSLPTLPVGTQTLTANYSGDTGDSGSISAPFPELINQAVATSTLSSSANPAAYGQAITLTASVSPVSATGNITLNAGSSVLGTAPLSNGTASLTVSTLPVGSQTLTATYAGDTNDSGAASTPLIEVINKAVSSIIVSSSANPATYGQTLTLTAAVTPINAAGIVTFNAGSNVLGTALLSNGIASLTLATLSTGSQILTAAYGGDTNDNSAASVPLTEVINKAVSTITLSSSANPAGNGQSVTLTASVTPMAAAGTVTFSAGGKPLGAAVLSTGLATLTLSTLSVGSHALTANYSGDANNLSSISATLAQVIDKTVTTSTTITSSLNPATYNQTVTLSARVSPSTAGGAVTFKSGSSALGTAVLVSGAATLTVATLSAGSHSLTASYSGDAGDASSVSTALTETINKISSAITLTSALNPSIYGQTISLTALVSPATATGNVTFKNGATALGAATLTNGSAALQVSNLPVGPLSLSVNYAGDANDTPSASAPLTQVVNKAVSAASLSSSLNPSSYRQSVTLTATVMPKTAGGSVTFKSGSVTLGTATLTGGTAKLPISTLAIGSQSLVAVYAGDANDAASSSSAISQTVTKASTTVTLKSSANPSTYGQKVTLTAIVSPSAATGTVVFKNGSINLGSAPLSNGAATVSPSALAVGPNGIIATYSGDAGDNGSSSTTFYQSALYTTSTTLSLSLNPAHFGQSVRLQATISSPGTPTGTVSFLDGTNNLGQAQVSSGTATLFAAGLTTGTHSLSAAYLGDSNNGGSASSPVSEVISPDSSAITLTSSVNPSSLGFNLTLNAAVSPSTATGQIAFYDGVAVLGAAKLNAGQASLQSTLLYSGYHQLTSRYTGDVNDSSSASTPLLQSVQAAPASGFQSPTTFPADASPVSLVTGDFNGDGRSDLAVSNQTANDISVFLGAGSGAFSNAVNYNAGPAPMSIATGDFNGDGRTDLAVANQSANTVGILLGNGDGTFASAISYSTGASPIAIVTGDFNRDGIPDLAAASLAANTVSILLGNGDGSFASPVNYNAGAAPVGLVIGDLNGDGIADLAVANQTANSVSILLGIGDGTFGAAVSVAVGSAPAALVVSDFNNDGKADLAVASTSAGTVSILLGDGDGTFGSLVSFSTGIAPTSLIVGDFNGDAIPDLAIADPIANTVGILQGNGDGTFQSPLSIPAGSGPAAMAIGEFNGDARSDLAVADQTGNTISLLLGAAPLAATSTMLTVSPNPSLYGQTVNLTAVVSPITATGTVTFNDASVALGSAPFVNGTAFLPLSTLARGTHLLTALYSGDQQDAPSTSPLLIETVGTPLTPTSTTLVSSLNPSASGQSVTLTATTSPQTATGFITFLDGSVSLGQVALTNGTAVFAASSLSFGPHALTASYDGDSNDSPSSSTSLNQNVTLPIPPPQPASGPGGSTYSFGAVTTHGPYTISGSSEYYYIYQPAQPTPASAPAVLFLHGYNFDTSTTNYQLWINHLVRNGYTVVWSYFQSGSDEQYLSNIEADWNAALQKIKNTPSMVQVAVDNTNTALTAVVAHSVGAYLALAIGDAASTPGNAFPKFHAIMATEPDQGQLPAYPLTAIDPGTRVVVVEGDEDKPVRLCEASTFWQDMSNIPVANRNVIEVISDSYGSPAQIGNHVFPLTDTTLDTVPPPATVDDRDYNVTWKLSVALLDCAFNGTYCDYALGNGTPEQLDMGAWSDGTPVAPMLYVPSPATQFQTDCTQSGAPESVAPIVEIVSDEL